MLGLCSIEHRHIVRQIDLEIEINVLIVSVGAVPDGHGRGDQQIFFRDSMMFGVISESFVSKTASNPLALGRF